MEQNTIRTEAMWSNAKLHCEVQKVRTKRVIEVWRTSGLRATVYYQDGTTEVIRDSQTLLKA
ncbi:hypothetical protein LCGC14_1815050 [marine sediment metagenome]|uniref:Uncharacterized protein n=1 Tax=marine sediment metagenome TaxID=412755 RepID=A0A0F9GKQ4_9ZZZZ